VKNCAHCDLEFSSTKKNQKYCTPACCRLATNKKIMEKYYKNKKRLSGEKRYCECGQLLSRYNEELICFYCSSKKKEEKRDKIIEVIYNVIKKTN